MKLELEMHRAGSVLPVQAQPGARRNTIVGAHAGRLKVAVTAAPEKGKANAAIAEVLAEVLNLPSSQITLLSGATGRTKRFLIKGLPPEELMRRLVDCPEGKSE